MLKLQEIFSDLVRLFIGPHGVDQPVDSWGTILLYISAVAAIFVLLNMFG